MKISTILILGVITVVELLVRKEIEASIWLWCLYGGYKLAQEENN
jgi:hypothetical protein